MSSSNSELIYTIEFEFEGDPEHFNLKIEQTQFLEKLGLKNYNEPTTPQVGFTPFNISNADYLR